MEIYIASFSGGGGEKVPSLEMPVNEASGIPVVIGMRGNVTSGNTRILPVARACAASFALLHAIALFKVYLLHYKDSEELYTWIPRRRDDIEEDHIVS